MNGVAALPLELRQTLVFALGAVLGSFVNLGADQLATFPRGTSPWVAAPHTAPRRCWYDRLPIVGWIMLRREAPLHGAWFWLRPLLVELGLAAGLAWLYDWEIAQRALWPLPIAGRPSFLPGELLALHAQFAVHALLIGVMLTASLIDADEKIIPDALTLPATLVGLILAAVYPLSMLPIEERQNLQPVADFIRLSWPHPWPCELQSAGGLALGLACWWWWCFAIAPRSWYTRHGWVRALQLCLARLRRSPWTRWIVVAGFVGSLVIAGVWRCGGTTWEGLLSALVGMVAGMNLIWIVRVVGSAALQREAMGFGDVTLMAMLGAFLGWQACLVIFFLAPILALAIGIAILVLRRDSEIAYGPFLCLGALLTIVRWQHLQEVGLPFFHLGLWVPVVLLACMIAMGVMLVGWQAVKRAMWREEA